MIIALKITANELIGVPRERNLINGKSITAFNLRISDKTINLNTGQKLHYENELYEIMNRESVQSTEDYLKFNCVRKVTAKDAESVQIS